ncbi:hypothetical protein M2404_002987 [Rheinheimera pacifica]|uniref:hypothetical protein n=1 Tax=Rheinheimera pacifica TaxID=173990 RepID=UPI00216A1D8C|nr:hypothetical protein [Rheinheimera pacifica]MCS4308629.1 hypothetical protein [Rheinheimera pacifica]
MTLNVNQSLNASTNISSVFAGNEARRALPRNETATEVPQGRGVRASNEVISQLDDERRQQTNFRSATDKRSQQAIDAYQSQANEQRRSEVQSMLGVDLYA